QPPLDLLNDGHGVTSALEAARRSSSVGAGGHVFGIMHSPVDATTEALDVLRARWSGPLMAYPESGYFEMPNWRFVEVSAPRGYAAEGREWGGSGRRILGGCCGLSVDHIREGAVTLAGPSR